MKDAVVQIYSLVGSSRAAAVSSDPILSVPPACCAVLDDRKPLASAGALRCSDPTLSRLIIDRRRINSQSLTHRGFTNAGTTATGSSPHPSFSVMAFSIGIPFHDLKHYD
ncbi:hypothetical protein FHL15_001574 [Xylaria flabelliformis]|uniref:Uncharacterized protein n=1 Tax=Xylaria flabelliformis TaxID=2512241 RepID=A0A553IAR3_9PEZI|nr:hypothetical protein FHL15_001574 [Xylaria flabelliformis]